MLHLMKIELIGKWLWLVVTVFSIFNTEIIITGRTTRSAALPVLFGLK